MKRMNMLLAAALTPLVRLDDDGFLDESTQGFIDELAQAARLPHRISDRIRRLFWAEAVLTGRMRRKRSLRSFKAHPEFPSGLKFLAIHAKADEELQSILDGWRSGEVPEQVQLQPNKAGTKRKRRRKPRRSGSNHQDVKHPVR